MVKKELDEKDLQKVGGGRNNQEKERMTERMDIVYKKTQEGSLECYYCKAKGPGVVSILNRDDKGVFFRCTTCQKDTYYTWEEMGIIK